MKILDLVFYIFIIYTNMKYYLGGGWNLSSVDKMKTIIKDIFHKEGISEVLHIPFAGVGIRHETSGWCMPEEFRSFVETLNVNYLNASYWEDIENFSWDCIYINWGHYRDFLLSMCKKPKLFEKIKTAKVIICESAWSMVLWQSMFNIEKDWFDVWLWLLNKFIVIPHYSTSYDEESIKSIFLEEKQKSGCSVLWIDETTFVYFDGLSLGEVIWEGSIYHM